MKSITVHFDDEALRLLRQHIKVRGLAGTTGGISDEAIRKIVTALDDGKSEVALKVKQ